MISCPDHRRTCKTDRARELGWHDSHGHTTAPGIRIKPLAQNERNTPRNLKSLANDDTSPLFLAVIEATEEAIYNSLFKATTTTGRGHTVEALPLDRTVEILRRHGLISPSH